MHACRTPGQLTGVTCTLLPYPRASSGKFKRAHLWWLRNEHVPHTKAYSRNKNGIVSLAAILGVMALETISVYMGNVLTSLRVSVSRPSSKKDDTRPFGVEAAMSGQGLGPKAVSEVKG